MELSVLVSAFSLLPPGMADPKITNIALKITRSAFIHFREDTQRRDRKRIDVGVKHTLFRPFAAFVLCLESDDIPNFLSPVLDSFCADDWVADLLDEFIIVEDGYNRYDNFWIVWNIFYDPITKLCQKGYEYWYTGKIIKTYLFASTDWPDVYASWNSLKKENSVFFEKFCRDAGQCQSVLYSVAKVLYGIGRIYLHDGIRWLAGVISTCNLEDEKVTEATVSYLEIITKIYIYEQKQMIKRTPDVKSYVLTILSFLVEKGSVTGFMLRESIL